MQQTNQMHEQQNENHQQRNINNNINPALFSAPQSIKIEVIEVINKNEKLKISTQYSKNQNAVREQYELLSQDEETLITIEKILNEKYSELKIRMKEVFQKLCNYEQKNFMRFQNQYIGSNEKIMTSLIEVASQFPTLKCMKIGIGNQDLVVCKDERHPDGLSINLRPQRNNLQQIQQQQQQIQQENPIPIPQQNNEVQQIQPSQNESQKTQFQQPLPPAVIRDVHIFVVEEENYTFQIQFGQPEDYGFNILNYRICMIQTEKQSLLVKRELIKEFVNDGNSTQSHKLTFSKKKGEGKLPFDQIIYLSIEAQNQNGWSSDLEISEIKLYLKYIEPKQMFIQGKVSQILIESQIIEIVDQIGQYQQRENNEICCNVQELSLMLIDSDRKSIRQADTNFNQFGIVNTSLIACQWGNLLIFENGDILQNDKVDIEKDFAYTTPYRINIHKPISKIICGQGHSLALTIDGSIISWGYNNYGQLGNGTNISNMDPQEITYFKNNSIFVIDIQAGQSISMCRSSYGDVYSWGYQQNRYGYDFIEVKNRQFETINLQCLDKENYQSIPRKVNIKAKQISTGFQCFGALSDENSIYMWGRNYFKIFGFHECSELDDQIINHLLEPIKLNLPIENNYIIKEFKIGISHCIIKVQHKDKNHEEFISWGNNQFGQCGQQPYKKMCTYGFIENLPQTTYKSFDCGTFQSEFLTQDNKRYTLGKIFDSDPSFKSPKLNQTSLFIDEIIAGEEVTIALGES